jgi:hypothetical protein
VEVEAVETREELRLSPEVIAYLVELAEVVVDSSVRLAARAAHQKVGVREAESTEALRLRQDSLELRAVRSSGLAEVEVLGRLVLVELVARADTPLVEVEAGLALEAAALVVVVVRAYV